MMNEEQKSESSEDYYFSLCPLPFALFSFHPSAFILCSSDCIVNNVADLTVAVYDHQTNQRVENLNKW